MDIRKGIVVWVQRDNNIIKNSSVRSLCVLWNPFKPQASLFPKTIHIIYSWSDLSVFNNSFQKFALKYHLLYDFCVYRYWLLWVFLVNCNYRWSVLSEFVLKLWTLKTCKTWGVLVVKWLYNELILIFNKNRRWLWVKIIWEHFITPSVKCIVVFI